jgi:hypothetical protein
MSAANTKTESEIHFEQFCERNHFPLAAVPVSTTKTPDYTLTMDGQLVVIEIKEVLPTAEEIERYRLAAELGYGTVIGRTPGKTVRKKIGDCSHQIKARTDGRYPGMLVLWESGQCAGKHTEPYHIRIAMEGFEQVVISLPPIQSGERLSTLGMKHGGGRKTTPDANTSISAIALLCMPGPDKFLLQVFHNRYAAIPLSPALIKSPEVIHYVLLDDPNRTTHWEQIEN